MIRNRTLIMKYCQFATKSVFYDSDEFRSIHLHNSDWIVGARDKYYVAVEVAWRLVSWVVEVDGTWCI